MIGSFSSLIAAELSIAVAQVEATVALLKDGATLPFIARYRKEATGNLDEVQIEKIGERVAYLEELEARRAVVLKEIGEQGKLTDDLKRKISGTMSKTELEDLYLPYKPKRRTRATIAKERGLQPLADLIWAQAEGAVDPDALARSLVTGEVTDVEMAWAGARDIVAERIAEIAPLRAQLREQALAAGRMVSTVIAGKEDEGKKWSDYFDYQEPVGAIPSHRMLALRRGEREGFLRVQLDVDRDAAIGLCRSHVVTNPRAGLLKQLELANTDAYDRLLKPSIEVDVRLVCKERADTAAIQVFAENLRNLLLSAPLPSQRVLGVDPGFRTGCKLVVLDEKGDLIANTVIYPTQSDHKINEAEQTIERLCRDHKIQAVAIGNGTASRETEGFFRALAKAGRLGTARILVVNEAGASVYSASEVAREELPDHDITVRGAVSIGRRLQDPLSELVKIDPKAIGVGQYQHDVHQPTLKKSLDAVVVSCVNRVGVDVNSASPKLLQYVAGVGETLAKNIVTHRTEHGAFKTRKDLLQVARFGQKAFEQAAGFLRVRGGPNPLDDSSVHPESYDIVEKMARDLAVPVTELVGKGELVKKIEPTRYVDKPANDDAAPGARVRGIETVRDILAELEKPGRDPRAEFEEVGFSPDVTAFEHVEEGMLLAGVVTNVTQFGAFIDIGVHQDGLAHVSELSYKFVKDPAEVVRVGERVKVRVLKVDRERRRIGLSLKVGAPPQQSAAPSTPRPPQGKPPGGNPPPRGPKPPGGGSGGGGGGGGGGAKQQPFNNPFAAALGGLRKP